MTNTPNNIAGEEWTKEFDEQFPMQIYVFREHQLTDEPCSGFPCQVHPTYDRTVKDIKAFIHKTRQEAIAGERERIYKEARYFRNNLVTDQMNDEYNDFLSSLQ